MRLDPESLRELPIHMQEQVALSFVPPAQEPNPVAGRTDPQRVTVRRLRFISRKAASRYKQLLLLSRKDMVKQIVMRKNEDGLIDRFFYVTEEVFCRHGRE